MNYLLTLDTDLVNDMIGFQVRMIRLEQRQRQLMSKLMEGGNFSELSEGSMEYWIDWNYTNRESWDCGLNLDELDEDDDEYDNPIYN